MTTSCLKSSLGTDVNAGFRITEMPHTFEQILNRLLPFFRLVLINGGSKWKKSRT